jgi:hypothetical protein
LVITKYTKGEISMKKAMIWGAGFVVIVGLAAWLFEGTGLATHNPNTGYSHNKYIGGPNESTRDSSPEQPGYDRHSDRTPDATPDRHDTVTFPTDGPDCGNAPGDGNCGNGKFASDSFSDAPITSPGDSTSDNNPDNLPATGFNRVGDEVSDQNPERINTDKYLEAHGKPSTQGDRVGAKDCAPADVAVGECDRYTVNNGKNYAGVGSGPLSTGRDRSVGRDGNATAGDRGTATQGDGVNDRVAADVLAAADDPARVNTDGDRRGSQGDGVSDRVARANADRVGSRDCGYREGNTNNINPADRAAGECDGVQDRNTAGTLRDAGQQNHSQPARDTFRTGPSDRSRDGRADEGGLGFGGNPNGGGGGGGGCSLVAGTSTDPASGLAYLLVLLAPAALVMIRRWMRK